MDKNMLGSSSTSAFKYHSVFTYNTEADTLKKYKSSNDYKSAFGYTYHAIPSFPNIESKECTEKESWPLKHSRSVIICISYLLVIVLFPISFWICFKKVCALERLVILRLGRLQPVVGPGYCVVLPFIDNWSRVDLQPKTFHFTVEQVLISDGAIVKVVVTIKYCISHAVHYVTKLQSQEQSFKDLVQHSLTNFVSEKEQTELDRERSCISANLKTELNNILVNWGLEILDIELPLVKILKEAEPVNALGEVLNALKSVATCSNNVSLSVISPPQIVQEVKNEVEPHPSSHCDFDKELLEKLSDLMQIATKKNVFSGVSAIYKLKILGETVLNVYIQVEKGIASLVGDIDGFLNEDVTIIFTLQDIKDFVNLLASPKQAYMEGRIQVLGDISLLKNLLEAFTSLS